MKVWEKSHVLVLAIYGETAEFPDHERYGLVSQMRRAAVSIPSNIAEGYGRGGDKELARFLHISLGSAKELEYQLLLARDLFYVTPEAYQTLQGQMLEIQNMIAGFIKRLRTPA